MNHLLNSKLQSLQELTKLYFSSWKEAMNWDVACMGRKGLLQVLILYYGLDSSMKLDNFYTLFRDGPNSLHAKTKVLKHADLLMDEVGYCFDGDKGTYVRKEDFKKGKTKFWLEERVNFMKEAKSSLIILQTYLVQLRVYLGLIESVDLDKTRVEIFLPHPDSSFAQTRNEKPHPAHQIDIPARIRENCRVFKEQWHNLGEPSGFSLYLFPTASPYCVYAKDDEYMIAPFWPHEFAAYTNFEIIKGGSKKTGDLRHMLHFFRENSEKYF
ncbi:MAG: hypothetical protein AAFY71_14310 [Bacteroidota bacterium]